MADEVALLIDDPHFHTGNLMMVADVYSLCGQHITFTGTGYKRDAILNAKRQLSPTVHQCRNSQVG